MKDSLSGFQINVPASTPSQAGDFIAATATATVQPGTHRLRLRLQDNGGSFTTGYHFIQILVGGTLVLEQDVAGSGADWAPIEVDLEAAVAGKTSVDVTIRLYDKVGVSNYPLRAHVLLLEASGLDLGARAWQIARQNAATWALAAVNRDYRGRCVAMTYASPTSWHADPPTVAYLQDALSLGHDAIVAGQADGVITYVLDKSPGSPTFDPVASLYGRWTGTAPDGGVADGGAGGPASASGCGCHLGGAPGGASEGRRGPARDAGAILAVALLAIGPARRRRRRARGGRCLDGGRRGERCCEPR
jgi:hypothetical protein